jgi:hypothetical protein
MTRQEFLNKWFSRMGKQTVEYINSDLDSVIQSELPRPTDDVVEFIKYCKGERDSFVRKFWENCGGDIQARIMAEDLCACVRAAANPAIIGILLSRNRIERATGGSRSPVTRYPPIGPPFNGQKRNGV